MNLFLLIFDHKQAWPVPVYNSKLNELDRTLAVTADLDNFSICGRAFYFLPNSAVMTNSNQKFDFTAHSGNNKQQGYWATTHVQRFYVVKILLARRNI